MTNEVSHFYGDDCDPPHEEDFLDEIIRESTERDPDFPEKLAEAERLRAEYARLSQEYDKMPGTPDQTGGAPPDAESLLDRLRRLDREATPADFGALANLVHMGDPSGDLPIAIRGHLLSLTDGKVERMLLDVKALWYRLPEIIEAFELVAGLREISREPYDVEDFAMLNRADRLLSKVSGQNG